MLVVLTIDISVTHCFNCQTMGGIKAVVGPSIRPRPASSCGQLLCFFAVVLGQHFLDLPNGKSWIQSLHIKTNHIKEMSISLSKIWTWYLLATFNIHPCWALTLGQVFVQFMMVWHLYTENLSSIWNSRSLVKSSRESTIHLQRIKYRNWGLFFYQYWLPWCFTLEQV